jgi:ATP-dependent Clp protease ATP-binding subunit ClpC
VAASPFTKSERIMKKSFRVYFVKNEADFYTGTLMRSSSSLWIQPPSAIGETIEDVYLQLERQIQKVVASGEDSLDKYMWDENFATNQVRIDVHPQSSIKKKIVIGKKIVPLYLTYAYSKLEEGGFRLMIPRFEGSLLLEDLSLAPSILRHIISSFLLGEDPSWIYEFRDQGSEFILEWSPSNLRSFRDLVPAKEANAHGLSVVADEWVERASKGKLIPAIGESKEMDLFLRTIFREPFPSLLLVGPAGVGKTTWVRRFAKYLVTYKAKSSEYRKPKLWASSGDKIIAGMIYLGMWQERCLEIVNELTGENSYLFVDRLWPVLKTQPGGSSIAEFLQPAMESGQISVIAECTESELERAQRQFPSFINQFTVVRIEETNTHETTDLLQIYASRKAQFKFHPGAIRRAIQHLSALVRGASFPGKGIHFIDFLAQEHKVARTSPFTPREISEAMSRYTGIPYALIADDELADSTYFQNILQQEVIGQETACASCGRLLARFKAGLNDPDRPVGTLLFVGPTGVGKTELAKQLTQTMFGSEKRMIRLDMSEFMLRSSAQRLLEVSAGGSSLAQQVHQQPLSLVLLDEIEKAHPQVFDLLLGVIGEGRLTDSTGRLIDFRSTVIVMTSNLGAQEGRPVGFGQGHYDDYLKQIRQHFRPEFFNRVDKIEVFQPLKPEHVVTIAEIQLKKMAERAGFKRRHLKLVVSKQAHTLLAERGYHPTRGARPLKRILEEQVVTPIAAHLAHSPETENQTMVMLAPNETCEQAFPHLLRQPHTIFHLT